MAHARLWLHPDADLPGKAHMRRQHQRTIGGRAPIFGTSSRLTSSILIFARRPRLPFALVRIVGRERASRERHHGAPSRSAPARSRGPCRRRHRRQTRHIEGRLPDLQRVGGQEAYASRSASFGVGTVNPDSELNQKKADVANHVMVPLLRMVRCAGSDNEEASNSRSCDRGKPARLGTHGACAWHRRK